MGEKADDSALTMFEALVRSGRSPAEAATQMIDLGIAPAYVQSACERHAVAAESTFQMERPPAALWNRDAVREPWYTGSTPADRLWPRLEKLLREDLGPSATDGVDRASTRIVSLLGAPTDRKVSTRGLVLGYVQSGKTTSFTSVIAKAADAGYRLVVVLSGIHNGLRRQTQERLDDQLVGLDPAFWIGLTSDEKDFWNPGSASAFLSITNRRFLCVVKKNKARLQRLNEWVESAGPQVIGNLPILVIDDEADQASVNTGDPADLERASKINAEIVRLLSNPRAAYIGYTATPFANILIDPSVDQQLYPRDFIVDLPRPDHYFGPERIFGREPLDHNDQGSDGCDMVRLVPDDEIADLQPPKGRKGKDFEPDATDTLREAVRYFLMATAARRARGQTRAKDHSTMLVHTTVLTRVHPAFVPVLKQLVREVSSALESSDEWVMGELREQWEREALLVRADSSCEGLPLATPFESVLDHLAAVADAVQIRVDNGYSPERLAYPKGHYGTVIVVGGNTLSRGLTLEGLVVSLFVRTVSTYDTLLQMGRWFGYRGGYEDLPRVWMTADLERNFRFLAAVEMEIRRDIERYELDQVSPLQFAVRIRTHPDLAITSELKMQSARTAELSYSGRRVQTILFDHRAQSVVTRNRTAVENLVTSVGRSAFGDPDGGIYIARAVDVEHIERFIASYSVHPDARELDPELLTKYIRAQNKLSELREWNIALMGRSTPLLGSTTVCGLDLNLIARARVDDGIENRANIKTLMSKVDHVVDLPLGSSVSDDDLKRERQLGRPPLLLIYPIQAKSEPKKATPLPASKGDRKVRQIRKSLDALDHLFGVAYAFPEAKDLTAQTYKTADLSKVERESLDIDLEDVDVEENMTEADENG